MKKKFAVLVLTSLLILSVTACSTSSNNDSKDGKNKFYWQEFYEEGVYDKFKTPASENGLDGTLIYVEGTVVDVIKNNEYYVVLLEDSGNNEWAYSICDNNINIPNTGDEIIAYSDYGGIATKLNNQPHGMLFRYIRGTETYKMTFKNDYSDFAYWYPWYEGYPDEHITDVIENIEDGVDYFDIYLTYSDDWDTLGYGEQCDLAEACIEYCADRATVYGLPQSSINVFAYRTDGHNAFSYNGGSEVRIYKDGKYDCDYYLE